MLNLLLKEQKKKIRREYRVRFSAIILALALAGEVITLILLFPSFLITKTRGDILNSQSVDLKVKNLNTETSELSGIVGQTNDYLSVLTSTSTPGNISEIIENVVDARGASIKLSNFSYRMNDANQQVIIAGTADSRQSLVDFVNKIKVVPGVVSADLPVSDFTKPQNIGFSITILINSKS